MGGYALAFEEVDPSQIGVVGGKGAHLAQLIQVDGVHVPPGFCVTTDAYARVVAGAPSMAGPLRRLSQVRVDDAHAIRMLSADVRQIVEGITIPGDVAAAITGAVARLGEQVAYAVRSSATAEDLPTMSFAGQQDSYLNVLGPAAVVEHVRRCWASLFTERAVTYRLRNGIDHHSVSMAVVVQRMVFPDAAGVMFTADPVTAHRRVVSIDASFGLGEALVSGLVNADVYKVRDGAITDTAVAAKQLAITALPGGGTGQREIAPERRQQAALTHEQIMELAQLGRRIEAHLGSPQDIEWCLDGDGFHIVQSRPITTLFPIPDAVDDGNHVYVSVGHQQMMTKAMKPLGLSFWQLTTPRPMAEAGGRLFVDVARLLATPTVREGYLTALGRSDPLIGDALQAVLDRGDFITPLPEGAPAAPPPPGVAPSAPLEPDPAIAAELVAANRASVAALRRDIQGRSGPALMEFIRSDIEELRRVLFDPHSIQVIMASMTPTWWLNEHLERWLGEKNAVDGLLLSVTDNVTSEMGLALLDVADAIRPHADVVAILEGAQDEAFLTQLTAVDGGADARDAILAFLDRYGMRCVGEIDITTPRWSERPSTLVPVMLSNVRNFAPGEAARRVDQGRREAADTERDLLARVRTLPDGDRKAQEVKHNIDLVRTFAGYREYPKYGMVSRYFVYKQALLGEAERLVAAGVLREREDMFYLRLEELEDLVRTQRADDELIEQRKHAFRSYEILTPPRVFTSDGEVVTGSYHRGDVPADALPGLAVSAGTIEGRARVILDIADADLEAGDILVTAYTDPSWTPVFVAVAGLVTEVGGLMTHGAVIAREYGLPAVVGVERATQLIRDGQRIRVHGTDGYVELLA